MRLFFFLSLLVLLAVPNPSPAGWGGGDCAPVGVPAIASESGYRWFQSSKDADAWGLRLNGQLVGGWRQSTGNYYAWLGNGWSEPTICPASLPVRPVQQSTKTDYCRCCGENCQCNVKPCGRPDCNCVFREATIESDGTLNFGLDREAISHRPRRIHNGREVSREQLLEAIGKAAIPDDASLICLTVIGPEADRQRVLVDLSSSPTLAQWKGKLKIQGYDPTHWAVRDSGFVTTGKPTIYCQSSDGKVLHRQDSYAGPEQLAEALRQADANYDPKKDPNLNAPLGGLPSLESILVKLQKVPAWIWLALALFLYLRYRGANG